MRYQISLFGYLSPGTPEIPEYPVGLRSKEFECASVEEAVSVGRAWGEDVLRPLGDTLHSLRIMEVLSPGKYRFYTYSLESGKLKKD